MEQDNAKEGEVGEQFLCVHLKAKSTIVGRMSFTWRHTQPIYINLTSCSDFRRLVINGGKHKSFYVSAGMTLGALKLLVKEERYFNILYSDDEQKIRDAH